MQTAGNNKWLTTDILVIHWGLSSTVIDGSYWWPFYNQVQNSTWCKYSISLHTLNSFDPLNCSELWCSIALLHSLLYCTHFCALDCSFALCCDVVNIAHVLHKLYNIAYALHWKWNKLQHISLHYIATRGKCINSLTLNYIALHCFEMKRYCNTLH